jgi:hypothetical protein
VSAADPVVGYPAHAVAAFLRWSNAHGARFTDWTAVCGATGTTSGHARFGLSGTARRAELCTGCWPSRSHADPHPDPVDRTVDPDGPRPGPTP